MLLYFNFILEVIVNTKT